MNEELYKISDEAYMKAMIRRALDDAMNGWMNELKKKDTENRKTIFTIQLKMILFPLIGCFIGIQLAFFIQWFFGNWP